MLNESPAYRGAKRHYIESGRSTVFRDVGEGNLAPLE